MIIYFSHLYTIAINRFYRNDAIVRYLASSIIVNHLRNHMYNIFQLKIPHNPLKKHIIGHSFLPILHSFLYNCTKLEKFSCLKYLNLLLKIRFLYLENMFYKIFIVFSGLETMSGMKDMQYSYIKIIYDKLYLFFSLFNNMYVSEISLDYKRGFFQCLSNFFKSKS